VGWVVTRTPFLEDMGGVHQGDAYLPRTDLQSNPVGVPVQVLSLHLRVGLTSPMSIDSPACREAPQGTGTRRRGRKVVRMRRLFSECETKIVCCDGPTLTTCPGGRQCRPYVKRTDALGPSSSGLAHRSFAQSNANPDTIGHSQCGVMCQPDQNTQQRAEI
jgi:hypothetical protein